MEQYGAQSVLGRPLGGIELIDMNEVISIINAYRSRQAAENWADWCAQNPEAHKLLSSVEEIIYGES